MSGYRLVWSRICISLACLATGAAVADEPAPREETQAFHSEIHAGRLRPHVEFLASPKMAGRSGKSKEQARHYIIEQWKAARLQPLFSASSTGDDEHHSREHSVGDALTPSVPTFLQPIPGPTDDRDQSTILGFNIGAFLPGTDPSLAHEIVVVGAHYDHLGTRDGKVYAGADDNATGVAMMIEAARHLSSDRSARRRSIVFVGFDLEENMLWGSRWFAAHPPWPIAQVKLFITADMIGRSLGNLPLPAVFVMGSEQAVELRTALTTVGTPPGLEVFRLGTDIVGTRSDYGPFRDRKIPFLFFSTGEHPDYHTPRDTPDKIDYEKAARIASLILQLTRHSLSVERSPVWSEPLANDIEEPKVLVRVTDLLLEADKTHPLTQTQRFFVTNVRNRAKKIIESNRMSPDERAWLIRMAQLLMVSIF